MIWYYFEYENIIKSCKRLKMFFEISVKDIYEWFDFVVRQIVQIGEYGGQDGLRKVRNGVKFVFKVLFSIVQDMVVEN